MSPLRDVWSGPTGPFGRMSHRAIALRLASSAVVWNPDRQSGPRRVEVPHFVAPGNGEHAWQSLTCACGVAVAHYDGRQRCK